MSMNFDTIIIGAGPGGYELAGILAAKGERVALIERDVVGGTCLNRGCIPTKTLCHAAETVDSLSHAGDYGVKIGQYQLDWNELMHRKNDVIEQLREGILLSLDKVEIIKGSASFKSDGSVSLDNGETLTANRTVIATGSMPAYLNIDGVHLTADSDRLLSLDSLPVSMTIIGGGVIGLEFAYIFNAVGVKVTVIEYCKEILPNFDKDIAKRLRTILSAKGIDFIVNATVTAVEPDGRVIYTQKSAENRVQSEIVAMAVGRRPNLPDGLDKAGIEYTNRGITVNPVTYETTRPGIYAIGDVNGLTMLAHVASAQAKTVAGEHINLSVVPSAVFTNPECAMVGLTEQQCKECALNYRSVKLPVRSNGKAVSMGQTDGMVKLIIDSDSRQILGCHILAPHASDMIQEIAVIMANSLPVDALTDTIHSHPTLSELLSTAASRL